MSELADKDKEFFYMLKEFWTTVSDFNVFIGIIGIILGFALLVILLRRINEIESRNKKRKWKRL